MTTLSKDEVLQMAREAGLRSAVLLHIHRGKEAALTDSELDDLIFTERFANLCRADLVAENERLTKLLMKWCNDAMSTEQVRELEAETINAIKESTHG